MWPSGRRPVDRYEEGRRLVDARAGNIQSIDGRSLDKLGHDAVHAGRHQLSVAETLQRYVQAVCEAPCCLFAVRGGCRRIIAAREQKRRDVGMQGSVKVRIDWTAGPYLAHSAKTVDRGSAQIGLLQLRPIDVRTVEKRHVLCAHDTVVHPVRERVTNSLVDQQVVSGQQSEVSALTGVVQDQRQQGGFLG